MEQPKPPPPGLSRAQRNAWEYLHRPRCPGCGWRNPLREWPLAEGAMLCDDCRLRRARGLVTTQWIGDRFAVTSTHPQRGQLHRGMIRAAGISPGGLQPAICWRLVDHEGHDLGELTGDFVHAVAAVLKGTAALDQIEPAEGPATRKE